MKKLFPRRMIAWVMTLCLLTGSTALASTVEATSSDFDVLRPFMDLVACAAVSASEEPEVVGDADTSLTASFISAFFVQGQTADASLGITQAMLTDTAAQAAYLGKAFAATLPTLEPITQTDAITGYIGFQPVTVNAGSDNDVQIIGELYQGTKAMSLTDEDFQDVKWLDRAVFSFRADSNAMNGYLLTGFSVGSELDMESAMQTYSESILVEYINTTLGFSILYPSVFTDDMLIEDGDGVSAQLADESASFFVKRAPNSSGANLSDYVDVIANGITNSKATLHEEFSSATVSYMTEDGYRVFDVYIVTDQYIYQAELKYKKELAYTYEMYTAYLENSFAVDAVSVG